MLALRAQGLLESPRGPVSMDRLYGVVEKLGAVQVDSIHVVERAHHHILAARLDGYRPRMLTRLHERERRVFEHWAHDAAMIPKVWFPHWKRRFARAPASPWWYARLGDDRERMLDAVLERVRRDGPVMSKDFERDGSGRAGGWWEWAPHKAALEYLWRTGKLSVAARVNFQKVYDLTERVLPDVHALPAPDLEEHIDWACSSALERLGIATPRELSDFWGLVSIKEATVWCETAAKGERVQRVETAAADGRPYKAFVPAAWRDQLGSAPGAPARIRLLSPFDPLVWDRRRTQRVFGFDYRFEAFVPAAKRTYGYYVLPILEGERLVGRLDPKLDRDRGVLAVNGLWWEPGVKPTKSRIAALERALGRFASFCGVDRWTLPRQRVRVRV